MFDHKAYCKEYSRYDREKARENGLCIVCRRKKAVPGKSTCEHCQEAKRIYAINHPPTEEQRERRRKLMRDLWAKRKENGLCPKCGKTAYRGKILCYECLIKRNRKNAEKRKKRDSERIAAENQYGTTICQKCLSPALPGKKLCRKHYDICLQYSTAAANAATKKRLEEKKVNHEKIGWREMVFRRADDGHKGTN